MAALAYEWAIVGVIAMTAIFLKFLFNILKKGSLQRELEKYLGWVKQPNDEKRYIKLMEKSQYVVGLWKKANLEDTPVPHVEPLGYGQGAFYEGRIFLSYPSRLPKIIEPTLRMLHKGIGVYRQRAWESFSPMHWIESVICLPKKSWGALSDSIVKLIRGNK